MPTGSIILSADVLPFWPTSRARRRVFLLLSVVIVLFLSPCGEARLMIRGTPPASSTQEESLLPCPDGCLCFAGGGKLRMDCFDAELNEVPYNTSKQGLVTILDLAQNNISHLTDFVFENYKFLEELNLAKNDIHFLSDKVFAGLTTLKELSLKGNSLSVFPHLALVPLKSLEALNLDGNKISEITADCLSGLNHINKLWLGENRLSEIPTEALAHLHRLEALDLHGNNIAEIKDHAFRNLTNLIILNLARNGIKTISDLAFIGLNNLKILEINDNKLKMVPTAIRKLRKLEQISFANNAISYIDDGTFDENGNLILLEMKGNPILNVGRYAFFNMTKLKKLLISEAKQLKTFPDLNGTESLEILRIDRAALRHVPADICRVLKRLRTLDLKKNHLKQVPNLTECTELRSLHLSLNQIESLEGSLFKHQHHLLDLELYDNLIGYIPEDCFAGATKLQILDLKNNKISKIHPNAFLPLKHLRELVLDGNQFAEIPHNGLEKLERLNARYNKYLKDFPGPSSFPRLRTLSLSYAYHCCQFLPFMGTVVPRPSDNLDDVLWPPNDKVSDMSLWNSNNTDIWPAYENLTARFGEFAEEIWGTFGPDYTYPSNLHQYIEDYFEENRNQHVTGITHEGMEPSIHCDPLPGPFMPCEDLFDWWTLRCGIWIVFLLAMLGNGTVVFVLIFSRSKMDVPRFLVCNLAMADFFMGIYLGILAVVDASTLGDFKKHAIKWQNSGGCQTAGFLGVLSSELSVYTLAVITLERNYAITHAMHLNKRLSLKHASYIMACGWTFAIIVASLPLFGVSDYRKFAICLPFEIEDIWSLTYVIFLMSINGLAFLILMGCYLKMYCAIRGSQAWNSNDSRIAKRMALLVFTDFICWAPIAFFSLTAVFGIHLVSLEEAKVFAIFVLPLNSCANPFLYAILTKQFKKDCVLICKAIEESRVTRGIGRCRHSSNFSNRQTPANTNSVIDRNSSNNGQVCSCQLKSGDSSNANMVNVNIDTKSGKKPIRKTWRLSTVRYLLCDAGVERDHDDSANEYAYALAEIQRGQAKKHQRNSSVSSENFSSSRSDSWRQKSVPLRLLESKRRRNSWTITRKPSQDSNLSNSRNDSSATTASTSTWRISRSSVSSDGSATRNARDKAPLPADIAVANAAAATGVRIRDRPSVVHSPPNRPPLTGRARPKLQRQIAISEDAWPACTLSIDVHSAGKTDDCMPIENIKDTKGDCFYNKLAEIVTEDSSSCSTEDSQSVPSSFKNSDSSRRIREIPTTTALSLAGFVPRKLSTISSRSGSMNHENSSCSVTNPLSTDDSFAICPPSGKGEPSSKNRSVSLLALPTKSHFSPQRSASVDAIKNQRLYPSRISQRRDSLPLPCITHDSAKVRIVESNWPKPFKRNITTKQVCFSVDDSDDDVFGPTSVKVDVDSEKNRLLPDASRRNEKEEDLIACKSASKEDQPLLHDNVYTTGEPT